MKKTPSPSKTTGTPRLFVALYDYDPKAMSPNPDNDEELPFKEGQTIKVNLFLDRSNASFHGLYLDLR